jgi:hypothetical protein
VARHHRCDDARTDHRRNATRETPVLRLK